MNVYVDLHYNKVYVPVFHIIIIFKKHYLKWSCETRIKSIIFSTFNQ